MGKWQVSYAALSCALALTAVTPAMAQDAAATPQASTTAAADDGEIIVTAQKRSERIQSVPISIQAAEERTLNNFQIASPRDYGVISPTLNFQAADEARLFNFSIRGIGTESFSIGVEPSVSTIVDGVVYTRVGSVFDGIADLERVEVLNGPQGTLQGKNASAGAVVIVTRGPERDALHGRIQFGLAENGEYSGGLMLTGPISDRVAFRVNGYYHREDGLVTNLATNDTVNNVESYGVRGSLLLEPADGVTLTLRGDWSYREADCCAEPIQIAAATGNVTAAFTGTPVGRANRLVNLNTVQAGSQKNRGLSLTGEFELGDHTITSITAYREYRDFAIRDRDGTNAPFTGVTPQQLFNATVPGISAADALRRMDSLLINPLSFSCRNNAAGTPVCGESNSLERSDTFSQEFRLASPTGGTFDYILGAFLYDSRTERDLTIAGVRSNIAGNVSFPTPTTVTVNRDTAYVFADMVTRVHTTNIAAFANVNFRPTSQLTLSAGVRALHERLDWDHNKVTGPNGDHIGGSAGTNPTGQAAPGANIGTPALAFNRQFNDSTVIGRLTARYEFSRDFMIYGSWARGYKGQAVDADIFVSQAGFDASPVAPETSSSFELGLRTQFWDRRITFNLTAYDTAFSGYQTSSSGIDGSGAPVLRSAGKLFTRGIEGEVAIRPVDGLRLSGNFLFADNRFGDLFVTPTLNIVGGNPLNAPESRYTLAGSYDIPVGDWTVNLSTNYTWTSSTLFTNLADAANPNSVWIRPSFGIANANINISGPDNRYRIGLYVKNLFDNEYVGGLRRISGSVGGAGAVAQFIPRDVNRYFGANFTFNF